MSNIATSIGLRVEGGYHHQTVFLRSESDQLSSELINVTVGKLLADILKTIQVEFIATAMQ